MMTTSTLATANGARKRYSLSETRNKKEQHLRLLEQLDNLTLSDSCCEICHCDCYSSHRSSNYSTPEESDARVTQVDHTNSQDAQPIAEKQPKKIKKKNTSKSALPQTPKTTRANGSVSRSATCKLPEQREELFRVKRSKSASSIHKQSDSLWDLTSYYTRDCEILQKLFSAFEDVPKVQITAGSENRTSKVPALGTSRAVNACSTLQLSCAESKQRAMSTLQSDDLSRSHEQLCESMASLCLEPTVRQAFQQVPTHDKKILNRMARKRGEHVAAKECSWLARKYWENERYERELLKCEQMEQYKLAVCDKQFQDFQLTKARLNELAQRDLAELQQLRESLQQKDQHAQRRLAAVRVEREIQLCQRRCEELRKSEAVNVHQEEQQLGEAQRKQQLCERLHERLQRAQQIRARTLNGYLKRLRHDNYIEQLLHEEHWRETQAAELQRRELLQQHISRKRTTTKRFTEQRQRRLEAISKTAKISASLRELVRTSVTPEAAASAVAGASVADNVPISLSRLLQEKCVSKINL